MKTFIDNWGMFLFMREFMQIVGSSKGLKLFMQYERYKLAVAVRAALECGAECKKPLNEVISLLFNVARRKGVLKEIGAECHVGHVPEPKAPPPQAVEEYFQMVDDVAIDKMCEYVAKHPSDVISEEETLAHY